MVSIGVPSSLKLTYCNELVASLGTRFSIPSVRFVLLELAVRKRKGIWEHLTSLLWGIRYRKPLLSLPGNFFVIVFS